jgi:hypothetical protein
VWIHALAWAIHPLLAAIKTQAVHELVEAPLHEADRVLLCGQIPFPVVTALKVGVADLPRGGRLSP